jgi:hypothetical protein
MILTKSDEGRSARRIIAKKLRVIWIGVMTTPKGMPH